MSFSHLFHVLAEYRIYKISVLYYVKLYIYTLRSEFGLLGFFFVQFCSVLCYSSFSANYERTHTLTQTQHARTHWLRFSFFCSFLIHLLMRYWSSYFLVWFLSAVRSLRCLDFRAIDVCNTPLSSRNRYIYIEISVWLCEQCTHTVFGSMVVPTDMFSTQLDFANSPQCFRLHERKKNWAAPPSSRGSSNKRPANDAPTPCNFSAAMVFRAYTCRQHKHSRTALRQFQIKIIIIMNFFADVSLELLFIRHGDDYTVIFG